MVSKLGHCELRRALANFAAMCFLPAALKTWLRCTLLSLLALALPQLRADDWISEEYRCALTIPTQESWTAALRQPLPAGEVIFHAASMVSNSGMMITILPDMPSSDIRTPAVLKRIDDLLAAQGWTVGSSTPIVWKNRPYLQYVVQRRDVVAGKLTGIVRVTPRGRSMYLITAYGRGEGDHSGDAEFMRVMETFRLTEQPMALVDHPEGPSAKTYRLAMIGTGSAAALLVLAFAAMLFSSRFGGEERA